MISIRKRGAVVMMYVLLIFLGCVAVATECYAYHNLCEALREYQFIGIPGDVRSTELPVQQSTSKFPERDIRGWN